MTSYEKHIILAKTFTAQPTDVVFEDIGFTRPERAATRALFEVLGVKQSPGSGYKKGLFSARFLRPGKIRAKNRSWVVSGYQGTKGYGFIDLSERLAEHLSSVRLNHLFNTSGKLTTLRALRENTSGETADNNDNSTTDNHNASEKKR